MKKILIILLATAFQCSVYASSYIDRQLNESKKNTKYNTAKIQTRIFNEDNQKNVKNLKDPKLIKLSDFTPVDEKEYNIKLSEDEKIYKSTIKQALSKNTNSVNVEPLSVDFYKVYRIAERLIRANNLDYTNWRIAISKSADDYNASASTINYICINTALYDTLYNDEDALAQVIAHEMSHLLLGHAERSYKLNKRLNRKFKKSGDGSNDGIVSIVKLVSDKVDYEKLKTMEYMADAQSFNLLIKAGYSPFKAINSFNYLEALGGTNFRYFYSSHPMTKNRIKNAEETIYTANPQWEEEGKYNIYNSDVLQCKKSSDRVSIIISKSDNNNKKFFEPETPEQYLTRIAYVFYLKGNMEKAIEYFSKLGDLTNNYVPYLYKSYANEYLYKQTKDEKYLKRAKNDIRQAEELNSNDENVKQQIKDLIIYL